MTIDFKDGDIIVPRDFTRLPLLQTEQGNESGVAVPLMGQVYALLKAMLSGDGVEFDDDTMTVMIDSHAGPQPPAEGFPIELGLFETDPSQGVAPSASGFSVQGNRYAAIPNFPAAERRYIIAAKRVSDGPITGVYYYADGNRNTANRLNSTFLPGTGRIAINGVAHTWIHSRVAFPSAVIGRIVELV